MNHTLAAMYNTNGYATAAQRQQVKVAHLENFAKVAAMSGFDLSNMSPQDVNALYAEYRQKVAEEGGESPEEEAREEGEEEGRAEEREEEEEEREEEERKEAQAAFLRAREFQEKVAEADHLGRVMAHAMWNETAAIKTAGPVGDKLRGAAAQVGGYARGAYKDARDAVKNKLRRPEPMKLLNAGAGDAIVKYKEPGMSTAKKVGLGVAGAAALGGAGYAGYKHFKNKNKDSEGSSEENKEASARSFDMQAARQAVKLAHAAGWDADEAATRLEALMTLGAPAAEKVAHALGSFEEARDVRALELLEAGGYPVDWDQVFG